MPIRHMNSWPASARPACPNRRAKPPPLPDIWREWVGLFLSASCASCRSDIFCCEASHQASPGEPTLLSQS
jgi:hypothetical protein